MQRGRKRIDWNEKATNAGFKNIGEAFAQHISRRKSGHTTEKLANMLGVSNMSLLLEFKRRGQRVTKAGAPQGNVNNKIDLRCDLFGFDNDEIMIATWRKDGLSGRAIADRIAKVQKVSFSTIHKRLQN